MVAVFVVAAAAGLVTVQFGPFFLQMLQNLRELRQQPGLVPWPGESIHQSMAGPCLRHLVGNSFENITGPPGAQVTLKPKYPPRLFPPLSPPLDADK